MTELEDYCQILTELNKAQLFFERFSSDNTNKYNTAMQNKNFDTVRILEAELAHERKKLRCLMDKANEAKYKYMSLRNEDKS